MRVLIVDSDQELLEIVQSFMSKLGHQAEIASNGLQCLDMLRELPPEVLVLEEELLWGNCDDILALMSEDSDLAQIPTILIGDDDPHPASSIVWRKQVFKSLRKPFHLGDLEACIDAAGHTARALHSW